MREPSAAAVLSSLSSALSHLRTSSTTSPALNLGQASVFRSFASYPASPPKVSVALPAMQTLSGSSIGSDEGLSTTPQASGQIHSFFHQTLDSVIDLNDVEVYSWQPQIEDDPHAFDDEDESIGGLDDDDLEGYLDDDESMRAPESDTDSDDLESSALWRIDGLPYAPPTPRRRTSSRVSSVAPSPYGGLKRTLSTLSIQDDEPRARGGLLWSSKCVGEPGSSD